MNFFFRVDSSRSIGFGHVMRCLVLAEKLRLADANVFFVCKSYEHSLIPKIKNSKFTVITLNNIPLKFKEKLLSNELQIEDARMTIDAIKEFQIDWLIVDNYLLGVEWEIKMREVAKKIMVIDDLAESKHYCDLLLNQNSNELELNYKESLNKEFIGLFGPGYSLLRDEFLMLRPKKLEPIAEIKSILIFLSGGDDYGETLKAMRGVWKYKKNVEADVVIGSSNLYASEIKDLCQQYHWNLLVQIDNLAERMANADFVVGSCGVNAWERCALGKPSISVVLASNQKYVSKTLKKYDASEVIGWFEDASHEEYCNIMKKMTKERAFEIANNAYNLVDANGANRVSDILLN
jgi:UDP-2,4-diacetamido-2,4,6-trideoxy-beta-L-altropyranose hydrolase